MTFLGSPITSETTAIESLIGCSCGHSLGLHEARGCRRCACHANRDDVLEVDIQRARKELPASVVRTALDID